MSRSQVLFLNYGYLVVYGPFSMQETIQQKAFVENPYVRNINYLTTIHKLQTAWFCIPTASYVFVIYVNSSVPKRLLNTPISATDNDNRKFNDDKCDLIRHKIRH